MKEIEEFSVGDFRVPPHKNAKEIVINGFVFSEVKLKVSISEKIFNCGDYSHWHYEIDILFDEDLGACETVQDINAACIALDFTDILFDNAIAIACDPKYLKFIVQESVGSRHLSFERN